MLVMLTENYMASPMCRFEFIEGRTRTIIDRTFRLIVIVLAKDIGNMQRAVGLSEELWKIYIQTRVHLFFGKCCFGPNYEELLPQRLLNFVYIMKIYILILIQLYDWSMECDSSLILLVFIDHICNGTLVNI